MIYMQTQQILVPRQVYIGDKAEIRCTFETDSVLFRNTIAQKGDIELSREYFINSLDETKWDVKSVKISSVAYNKYSLVVSFTPWRTGVMELPPYDIGAAINSDAEVYVIGFEPQEIVSISKTQGQNTLKEMNSPLLLPGTTYKIYGAIILILFLVFVIIRITLKRKSLMFYINNKILMYKYSKNKKMVFKKLIKLEQVKNLTDSEIATEIQKIMREYLEFRFDYPFTKTLASEISGAFTKLSNGLFSEKKETACDEVASVFIRTDYVRYGNNISFEINEKQQLISRLMNAIEVFEKPEEKTPEQIIEEIHMEDRNA